MGAAHVCAWADRLCVRTLTIADDAIEQSLRGRYGSSRDSLTAYAVRQVYIRNRTNPRPVAGAFGLADAIFPGADRGAMSSMPASSGSSAMV
jgi:hypothetical protein